MKTISFVIPVLNGERDMAACLDSITANVASQDEIILVDNGSTDGTLEIAARYERLSILKHPECTIGGLRNRGAEKARGDIVAFIDADCVVCPGWREAVTSILSRDNVHATGSISVLPENPSWVERVWLSERKRTERKVNYIPSANFIIRKDIFHEVHGFDETLVTDEDSDIGARINQRGYTILDSPDVRVIHLGNAKTIMQFARRQKWHAISMLDKFEWKRPDKPAVMTFLFAFTVILAFAIMPVLSSLGLSPWWGLLLMLVSPVLTAIYRTLQYGNFKYFVHLAVLYFVYYFVRMIALAQQLPRLFRGGPKHAHA
jgi:glycosyltransferase involved in cell wall biosynthesis